MSYGAVATGKSATTDDVTLHSGVVKLGLQVARDSVVDPTGNAPIVAGSLTKLFGAGGVDGPTQPYVRVDVTADIRSQNSQKEDMGPGLLQIYGVRDINFYIATQVSTNLDTSGVSPSLLGAFRKSILQTGPTEIFAGIQALSPWDVLVVQAGSADQPDRPLVYTADADKSHVIIGGGGNDEIKGSTKRDFLLGGAGNDTFEGGGGNDVIVGGVGDDTYIARAGEGNVTFIGGAGTDTARYDQGSFNGEKIEWQKFQTSAFNDRYSVSVGKARTDNLFGIEHLYLDDGKDVVQRSRRAALPPDPNDVTGSTGNAGQAQSSQTASDDQTPPQPLTLHLGGGDDEVQSAPEGTVIYTDGGKDNIWVSKNIGIADLSADDRITIGRYLEFHGGLRYKWSESPWAVAYGGLFKSGINQDGELVVQVDGLGTVFVLNWQASGGMNTPFEQRPGHISVFEFDIGAYRLLDPNKPKNMTQMGTWDLMGAIVKANFGVSIWKGVDPLTLDLNGNGFSLTTQSTISPRFDMDGDFYAERTAWVEPDDGFLVRDLNHNGKIDDVTEMFGGAGSGFAALATLDGNHDGVVDARDNGLADFNGDGIVHPTDVDDSDTIDSLKAWRDPTATP